MSEHAFGVRRFIAAFLFQPARLRHPKKAAINRRTPKGFTLIEVVVATMVLAILLAGMASAIMLAGRAVPTGAGGTSAVLAAGRAADMLAADLFYATSIITASPTELVFTVADRTGDGTPETIRYYWSGNSGDPLTRQFNGGTAAVVIPDVREFQLAYDTRPVAQSIVYSSGPETLLANYTTGWIGLSDATVTNSSLVGQYFQPTLPANAQSWSVTRVRFLARQHGAPDGATNVQLRFANGAAPGDCVIEQCPMAENTLSGVYQWVEFSFSKATGLLPGDALCLVLAGATGALACDVRVDGSAPPSNSWSPPLSSWCILSNNGGGNWSTPPNQSLVFQVYGQVSQYRLTDARVTLRSGPDAWTRAQTSIRVVSEPQMP